MKHILYIVWISLVELAAVGFVLASVFAIVVTLMALADEYPWLFVICVAFLAILYWNISR